MKSFSAVLSVLALSMPLTGCQNATLNKAIKTIQRNDVPGFQEITTGEALKKYGTANGVAELNAKIAGFSDFELADEKLIASKRDYQGFGRYGDVLRVYTGELVAKASAKAEASRLATIQTECQVSIRLETDSSCRMSTPVIVPPINNQRCIGGMRVDEHEDCKISDIRF